MIHITYITYLLAVSFDDMGTLVYNVSNKIRPAENYVAQFPF